MSDLRPVLHMLGPQCCVPRCSNRSESKKTIPLSFYHSPSEEKEKRKWLQLISVNVKCLCRIIEHWQDDKVKRSPYN
eukprot:superscaffoldBa00004609_g19176